jgi:hypothetical protein
MQANDDNENEDDALEGLAQLNPENPYQGAPIHREEQFRDSNLVNGKFDKSSLWKPFATSSDAYATLELESFVNKKVNGIYQLVKGGNQCRVACRGDIGRIKWNKVLKKYQPIGRNSHCCIKKRLPFVGVGAERATTVVMLSVCVMSLCAMSVCAMSVCTGVCATVRAAAAREVRSARVGGGGVSIDDGVGTSVARNGTERTSALDRSTEMGDPVAAVGSGDFV